MQIGNNIYINLIVNGMNVTDLLQFSDVLNFRIVETAGASLPFVYMRFLTRSQEIMDSVQLGNTFKISIGNSPENADTFEVDSIQPTQPVKDPSNKGWVVELAGFIGSKTYMVEEASKSYFGNSMFVCNKVLKKYLGGKGNFHFNSDFKTVNENQIYWRRNNRTACYFITDTLLHMDVRPSFPLFAFDKYKNFYLKDLDKAIKEGPKYIFSAMTPTKPNMYQYLNNLNVETFREEYNLYSGYNKMTEVYGSDEGVPQYIVDSNTPIIASTSIAEEQYVGNIIQTNEIQSSNVHKNYTACFVHNTNKLISLSTELGALVFVGEYHKNFKPLDLIQLNSGADSTDDGYYLIDTILTEIDTSSGGIRTIVYITRDNKNRVEDSVYPKPAKGIKVLDKLRNDIVSICQSIKVVYAQAMRFMDGRFLGELLSFGIETKYNLLHSFRADGFITDFTSGANLLNSLVGAGNSLMNKFVYMMLPKDVASLFNNFLIDRPSLQDLLLSYIDQYVDPDVVEVANLIANLVYSGTMKLNEVAKDNGIFITIAGGIGATTIIKEIAEGEATLEEQTYQEERQPDVNDIIDGFENNTSGLDIPFPRITLTESEAILPQDKLKDVIANKTIDNLNELGYLKSVDKDKLKDIMLGKEPIDFNIINAINKSAGDSYSYRFWGTFKDITELADFYIKKAYKDKYRTIPCTKLVSAIRNSKIFFACPASETDLKFYINSKRVEMQSFTISLGYKDIYGTPILYNVYYNDKGYNSNSVLFEVKQGGMV